MNKREHITINNEEYEVFMGEGFDMVLAPIRNESLPDYIIPKGYKDLEAEAFDNTPSLYMPEAKERVMSEYIRENEIDFAKRNLDKKVESPND